MNSLLLHQSWCSPSCTLECIAQIFGPVLYSLNQGDRMVYCHRYYCREYMHFDPSETLCFVACYHRHHHHPHSFYHIYQKANISPLPKTMNSLPKLDQTVSKILWLKGLAY
jgi:hypothetical protein